MNAKTCLFGFPQKDDVSLLFDLSKPYIMEADSTVNLNNCFWRKVKCNLTVFLSAIDTLANERTIL